MAPKAERDADLRTSWGMPVVPPVSPMLAKPVKDFSAVKGEVLYEPKWDGFRSIIFRSGDLLALGDESFMERPFAERRAALEEALGSAVPPIHVTAATADREIARGSFTQFEGAGLDGVIAKPVDVTYEPDKRLMSKIKHERTADCVVAGYRVHKSGPDAIGSLLLGLHGDDGRLASVGVIGAFPMARRKELFEELQPLVAAWDEHPWNWAAPAEEGDGIRTPRSSEYSRWNNQKDLSFVPLRPERVVDVRPARGAGQLRPRRRPVRRERLTRVDALSAGRSAPGGPRGAGAVVVL